MTNHEYLHLGCGARHIPGFFHVDALTYDHVDYQGPVDQLDFIKDNAVKLIYACHVLEHFGRHEYKDVLAEWFRVLAPGGVLRLAVPDFRAVAEVYCDGAIPSIEPVLGLLVGGQRDMYDYHKMVFDEQSLTAALLETGFSQTRLWDWRLMNHAHIDDYSQAYLPHMDKNHGRLMSLNMEAVK